MLDTIRLISLYIFFISAFLIGILPFMIGGGCILMLLTSRNTKGDAFQTAQKITKWSAWILFFSVITCIFFAPA